MHKMQDRRDRRGEKLPKAKLSERPIDSGVFNFAFCLLTFYFLLSSALAKEIGPESELCAEINRLLPGDELALRPGDYRGPCIIRGGGTLGKPIVIRSHDARRRARIVYADRESNVIEVKADY